MKNPTRILIAQNEDDLLLSTAKMLADAGYKVHTVVGGTDILKKVSEERPDLVLLDRDLPDVDSLKLCLGIKTDFPETFAVLISGANIDSDHQAEGLSAGADGYILRPISSRDLVARIESYIKILRLTRSLQKQAVQLQESNVTLRQQRMASLNLMRDAVAERDRARQANEALKEREALFRSLVEGAPDAIFVEVNGNFAYANIAACNLFGADAQEQIIGQTVADRIHPGKRAVALLHMRLLNDSRESVPPIESIYLKLDGSQVPVEVSAVPIVYQGTDGALFFARDISERKQAEEEITGLARFLSENPDPVLRVDSSGKILAANKSSRPLLRHWECQDGQRLPETWCNVVEMALKVGSIKNIEVPCGESTFSLAFVPVAETGYVNIYGHDITKTEAMRKERNRLAMAVEHAAEAIILTDAEGVIQYVNPAFEKITGYTRAEVIGNSPRILKSGKHDEAFYRDLWQTISSGHHWRGRLENKRKNGTLYTEDTSITPVQDETGNIVNYVAVAHDISDRMALERHIRQAQKLEAIGTLASGIAHDFNNALAAILGYTSVVIDEMEEENPHRKDLQQVLIACTRAKDLVKQILTFSRKVEQERQPVGLHHIVKEAVRFLRSSTPPSIEIDCDYVKDCGSVLADPTQLSQIVMNLCTNAIHAMKTSGGILRISLDIFDADAGSAAFHPGLHEGSYVRLAVSDTGHGIDKTTQEHIFEPFFTTKEPGEGTGLGLSTTYGIVNAHGGAITVYSEPGQGATFHVYLPRLEGESRKDEVVDETIRGGNERILIVDDEPPLVSLMEKVLNQFGYMTLAYTQSQLALDAFRESPQNFDLVVADYAMPEMNGIQLARAIKDIRPDIPVILSSGYQFLLEEHVGVEITTIIPKPTNVKDTARIVRDILDKAANEGERYRRASHENSQDQSKWSVWKLLAKNRNLGEEQ